MNSTIQQTIQKLKDKFREEIARIEEYYKNEIEKLISERDFWKIESSKMENSWREAEYRYSQLMSVHQSQTQLESDNETLDSNHGIKREIRKKIIRDAVKEVRRNKSASKKLKKITESPKDALTLGGSTKASRLRKLTSELQRELSEGIESPAEIRKSLKSLQIVSGKTPKSSRPNTPRRSKTPKKKLYNEKSLTPKKTPLKTPNRKKSINISLNSPKALPFESIWDEILSDSSRNNSPIRQQNTSLNRTLENDFYDKHSPIHSPNSKDIQSPERNATPTKKKYKLSHSPNTQNPQRSQSPLVNFDSPLRHKNQSSTYQPQSPLYSKSQSNSPQYRFASPQNLHNRSTSSIHSLDNNSNLLQNVVVEIPHEGQNISVSTDTAEMLHHIRSLKDMLGN